MLSFQDRALAEERHPQSGQKDEIVAQGHARALSRAFAHMLAQSAIERAVDLVFAYAKLALRGADIAEHPSSSFLPSGKKRQTARFSYILSIISYFCVNCKNFLCVFWKKSLFFRADLRILAHFARFFGIFVNIFDHT